LLPAPPPGDFTGDLGLAVVAVALTAPPGGVLGRKSPVGAAAPGVRGRDGTGLVIPLSRDDFLAGLAPAPAAAAAVDVLRVLPVVPPGVDGVAPPPRGRFPVGVGVGRLWLAALFAACCFSFTALALAFVGDMLLLLGEILT